MESTMIKDIKNAMENEDTRLAASIIEKYLEDTDNIPLNIAVTGESGSGKSTLVGAFRGKDVTDEGAAPTVVVETTTKPEPYPHPHHPNVILWDLPGIGTTKFPTDKYLQCVGFEKFDFFIIVSADRFKENDAKLAQEIKKMGKKFYFVRSKIDNNLRDEKKKLEYNEENIVQQIRKYCIQGLEEQGVASPQVFLVSGFELHLYDFSKLLETMEGELPTHKKDVLILALPNICKTIIRKKTEVFRSQIKFYAILSAGVAALPVPGLSIAADLGILVGVITKYLFGFGLDKSSLEKHACDTKTPLTDLKAVIKSPCSGMDITAPLVMSLLRLLTVVSASMAAEEVSRWIPVVGLVIASALSFTAIYMFLSSILDSLSVDAENVHTKAFDKPLGMSTSTEQ